MKSRTTRKFWRLFDELPANIQNHARRSFRQFQDDAAYPALNFKRVSRADPIYSVRIGIDYRAVGYLDGDTITWFWIGIHDDYERILNG